MRLPNGGIEHAMCGKMGVSRSELFETLICFHDLLNWMVVAGVVPRSFDSSDVF